MSKKQYEITTKNGNGSAGSATFDNVHEAGIFKMRALRELIFSAVPRNLNQEPDGQAFTIRFPR